MVDSLWIQRAWTTTTSSMDVSTHCNYRKYELDVR